MSGSGVNTDGISEAVSAQPQLQLQGIAIGIVGPEEMVSRIRTIIVQFPSFRPLSRVCETEAELQGIVAELAAQCEVVLIAGTEPLRKGIRPQHSTLPIHYLPPTGAGLYRALLRLQLRQGHGGGGISVDSLSRSVVERALSDSGASFEITMFEGGGPNASHAELIQYHRSVLASGKCRAALTGSSLVQKELTRLGYAAEWVTPTDQDITVSLERALLETRRSKESQIVVGLINVDGFGKVAQRSVSEHEMQRLKLDIHRLLLDYVDSLNGYLTHLGGDEYLFVTTRGVFERETGGYKTIPLAKDVFHAFEVTLSIGVGFGKFANEAGAHARAALGSA